VVANCDHLEKLRFSSQRPNVFTEYGALMLANVIKSYVAIEMSILIVRAFARLREMLITHKDLQRKIETMEKKYDRQFKAIFDAIKQLLISPEKPKRRIGFHADQ